VVEAALPVLVPGTVDIFIHLLDLQGKHLSTTHAEAPMRFEVQSARVMPGSDERRPLLVMSCSYPPGHPCASRYSTEYHFAVVLDAAILAKAVRRPSGEWTGTWPKTVFLRSVGPLRERFAREAESMLTSTDRGTVLAALSLLRGMWREKSIPPDRELWYKVPVAVWATPLRISPSHRGKVAIAELQKSQDPWIRESASTLQALLDPVDQH
jgi:hypothetical protein